MMPLAASLTASGFTSDTTSGTSGSSRQADELSTTTAPASANRGACSREVPPPAENSAMSMSARSSVAVAARSSTRTSTPANGSVLPAERAEAKNRTAATGSSRSSRRRRITAPTWPVAPTTATFTPCSEMVTMSAPRSRVDDRLAVDAVELERGVHGAHGVVQRVRAGDHRDADLRGGDHLDVDAGVAQRAEQPRRDSGVRLHARAHERQLADLVVELQRVEPDLRLQRGQRRHRRRPVALGEGERDVRETRAG